MTDAAVAVAAETPVTPAPLGSLESLTDFRARRSEADAPADTPEPVANPAEGAEEAPAVEAEPDASAAGKALAAKKGSLQARIDEITREKHSTAAERDAAKAEAAALRAEIATLKAGSKPETATAAPAAPAAGTVKPTPDGFETLDAYFEALADWKLEQREAKQAADAQAAAEAKQRETAQTEFQTRAQGWIERRDTFAASEPEFATVAMPFLEGIAAGTPIGDAILDSEVGPQVALYLAKNQAEVERIGKLPWRSQIREIGKIEAKVSAAGPVEPKAPPVSKAPAPVKPPTQNAPAAAAAPDPSNISSLATWRSIRKNF